MSADRARMLAYALCGVLAALAFVVGEIVRPT
jgi:ribose/xylose/arabinose/galactoside ABC-type transport system permease subunit